jgi:predicted GIY-YIG superfamily endonuclease
LQTVPESEPVFENPAASSSASALQETARMAGAKNCVYVLKSLGARPRYYTGLTSHVPSRLAQHNAGLCSHTASGRPWEVDVVIDFADEARARRFERYLKSGSGNAFAVRHLR